MRAAEMLRSENICLGIVLLEKIKPYDECAERVAKVLPKDLRGVIFYEEELRNGGMGMSLADRMVRFHGLGAHRILATDDSFVSHREVGQSIYDAAGVSAECLCERIRNWNE